MTTRVKATLVSAATGTALLAMQPAHAAGVTPLERVVAIEDIKALKARYLMAIDGHDRAGLLSTFAKDISGDYTATYSVDGSGKKLMPEIIQGAEAVAGAVSSYSGTPPFATFHSGGAPIIEITSPTTARAIWPVMGFRRPDPTTGAPPTRVGTWYYNHDTYVRIGGAWKIQSIRVTYTADGFRELDKPKGD